MLSTAANDLVHVAVGILTDRDRYFITRRAPGAHQGGKWEYPGGKVHSGESVQAALQRELHEELGIEVHAARPLMQVRHRYPDKEVLLDVWSVIDYTGEPHGREGQEARWASHAEMLTLDFPEADLPIQRRLWLPTLYAVSDCARYGESLFMERLDAALTNGLQLLQLREPELAHDAYVALARRVIERCRPHGAKVLLNAEPQWMEEIGADGVHLNSRRLMKTSIRPLSDKHFVAASCHNVAELAQAHAVGADLMVLGPVEMTRSHPAASPMGWGRFSTLCALTPLPVYALGGVRAQQLAQARTCGARGIAMMSGIWEAPDIGAVVRAATAP